VAGDTSFTILLLMIGVAGMVIELSHPGLSAPGFVGAAALIIGVLYLIGVELPEVDISPAVVVAAGIVLVVLCVVAVRAGLRIRRLPVYGGDYRMLGARGVVTEPLDPNGQVRVKAETWTAVARDVLPIPEGAAVKVVAVRGLTLEVVPVSSEVPE
jgi:membrane-bound serine protease (ClpP class)